MIGDIEQTQIFNSSDPLNATIMNDNLTTLLLHDILKTALNISGNMSQEVLLVNETLHDEEQGKCVLSEFVVVVQMVCGFDWFS